MEPHFRPVVSPDPVPHSSPPPILGRLLVVQVAAAAATLSVHSIRLPLDYLIIAELFLLLLFHRSLASVQFMQLLRLHLVGGGAALGVKSQNSHPCNLLGSRSPTLREVYLPHQVLSPARGWSSARWVVIRGQWFLTNFQNFRRFKNSHTSRVGIGEKQSRTELGDNASGDSTSIKNKVSR